MLIYFVMYCKVSVYKFIKGNCGLKIKSIPTISYRCFKDTIYFKSKILNELDAYLFNIVESIPIDFIKGSF